MRRIIALAIAVVALSASCQEQDPETKTPAPSPAPPAPAPTLAEVAGMCSEHQVLEAVCTKCNPQLIPVFQAKGDWCPEHDLPESFCPICHPERGGRPALDASPDEAPADGTKIRFKTKETARLAGIETAPAVERPSQPGVVALARIAYDATHVAHVNARAAGVVRSIHVDVGSRVRRGAPLAVIESAVVGADQSKLLAGRARVELAEANYQRTKDLHQKGIVPTKDVLAAQQELKATKAEHEATLTALRVVGTSGEDGTYTLVAPLAGIVTERNTSIGSLVDVEEMLFEVVDPSSMWAEIDIREADVPAVLVGQSVALSVDGLGNREFSSRIDYIAPAIDPKTRTVRARARLANSDAGLRANMYGRARIDVAETRSSVVVPRSAVQQARGVPVVFVRLAEDLYEMRRVQAGPAGGSLIELAAGVRPGELVVTQGSFLLKTETLKESIGAGCCEVEEAK